MKRITTLIVDDEPLAREGIALMLKDDPEMEVVGSCADGRAALEEIRDKRPDLVFLDVQMPRLNGFETLECLASQQLPAVIFVTAHDKYAVEAFEAHAIDYLLKPFRDARFQTAVCRAKERIRRADFGEIHRSMRALLDRLHGDGGGGWHGLPAPEAGGSMGGTPMPREEPGRIGFKIGGGSLFLDAREIIWVEAQGDGIRLGAEGQTHEVREPLHSVEQRLDGKGFLRVHRSFLANIGRIRKITSALYGDYVLLMSDGTKIPLSRSYRDKFRATLQIRLS